MKKFSEDFIFGAATAAYQAEGAANIDGRGKCYWDEYFHRAESTFNGDVASDFYHKYKDDIKLCEDFGINGIRISISWSRIFPEGFGEVNKKGLEYYNNLIDECIKNGVEPFVTMHHFDTPLSLFKNGDWLDRKNIDYFVEFSKVCFENFGDRVKKWITINEPWSVVAGQYIIGHFPPNNNAGSNPIKNFPPPNLAVNLSLAASDIGNNPSMIGFITFGIKYITADTFIASCNTSLTLYFANIPTIIPKMKPTITGCPKAPNFFSIFSVSMSILFIPGILSKIASTTTANGAQ